MDFRSGSLQSEMTKRAALPLSSMGSGLLDRQWIIPDKRLINQPNPKLWEIRSDRQIFLTAPWDRIPSNGPALSASAFVPDAHHYAGRGGRVFPLWADGGATQTNIKPALLIYIGATLGTDDHPRRPIQLCRRHGCKSRLYFPLQA